MTFPNNIIKKEREREKKSALSMDTITVNTQLYDSVFFLSPLYEHAYFFQPQCQWFPAHMAVCAPKVNSRNITGQNGCVLWRGCYIKFNGTARWPNGCRWLPSWSRTEGWVWKYASLEGGWVRKRQRGRHRWRETDCESGRADEWVDKGINVLVVLNLPIVFQRLKRHQYQIWHAYQNISH